MHIYIHLYIQIESKQNLASSYLARAYSIHSKTKSNTKPRAYIYYTRWKIHQNLLRCVVIYFVVFAVFVVNYLTDSSFVIRINKMAIPLIPRFVWIYLAFKCIYACECVTENAPRRVQVKMCARAFNESLSCACIYCISAMRVKWK